MKSNSNPSSVLTAQVETDENGDQYLQFDEGVLEEWDWRVDDIIDWKTNDDGSIIMENRSWKERNSGKDNSEQSDSQ